MVKHAPGRPRTWNKTRLVLATCVLLVLAAGCGGNTPANDDPGSLVVYSGRAESLVGPIIQQFQDQTGVQVEVRYGGTPALAQTLLEEGDRSTVDVFFAQDPGGLGAVEGMLAPLPESILERVPEWARARDGRWVGVTARARVLSYNMHRVDPNELPADIYDLIDPQWRGRIGWAPTNGSFLTMVTGMRKYWGEEKTRQWIEGMVANRPTIFPNNSSQVVAVAAGEVDVALVNHYYLYPMLAQHGESFAARNYHPQEGPGALVMISGAGMLATAPNREAAERFIAFLLEAHAQDYFAAQTYEYPLMEGVPTDSRLTPLDQINWPDIAMADMADLDGTTEILRQAGALP